MLTREMFAGVMAMLIHNARVFTGAGFAGSLCVRVCGGAVAEVGPDLAPLTGEEMISLDGDFLLPGFVDVHIHGSGGFDTMRGEEDVRGMSRFLRRQGVAAFCPTTMAASPADTARALAGIGAVRSRPEPRGAQVLGAHLEAPFLNPRRAGAQDPAFLADPNPALLEMPGIADVRLITVAPELPGAEDFIRAADWGADHATHLFNASSPLSHRAPGLPGAVLADPRFYGELICDMIHLHRDTVRLAAACLGPERAVAVTDAMEAAGLPDGTYALGGQPVLVRGGEARLADGTLAGSVLTMAEALRRLIRVAGIDPVTACRMVTVNPAASIGEPLPGRILPGSPLPLTRWTPDWTLREVVDPLS